MVVGTATVCAQPCVKPESRRTPIDWAWRGAQQVANPQDKAALAASAHYSGDPWTPDNPYFDMAEASMDRLWNRLVWPFISECAFDRVVDLASGHGRNIRKLIDHASHIHAIDIQPGNVDRIAERYAGDARIEPMTGTGYDLHPLADASCTLIYCFDAMVHFNADVVASYLRDSMRVLRPGGHGFFHHSNYSGGMDWRTNPGSRAFMTAGLFHELATKAGLRVVRQEVIDWGPRTELDALTLVERPASIKGEQGR